MIYRLAPYDGFRMAEPGEKVAADWRRISDDPAVLGDEVPPASMVGLAVSEEEAERWSVPYLEDPRVAVTSPGLPAAPYKAP